MSEAFKEINPETAITGEVSMAVNERHS
jgi:hypothetical protein